MIIYGEALVDTAGLPMTEPRISLDSTSPRAAHAVMQHLRDVLTIRAN
jgi:hypothetical protein